MFETVGSSIAGNYALNKRHVDVWLQNLSVDKIHQKLQHISLSYEEMNAAHAFHFDKDRINYIRSHQYLRFIISRYLRRDPEKIIFAKTKQGKPVISLHNHHGIEFNMSHSGDYVAIAIGKEYALGIDIEAIDTNRTAGDIDQLAQHCFSEQEFNQYNGIPENLRSLAFFRGWTRKEAYLKALGIGLEKNTASFNVNLYDEMPQQLIREESKGLLHRWCIQPITTIEPYYAATVVVNSNIENIYFRSLW